jgi:two-component system, NarL family, response regulator LiaR
VGAKPIRVAIVDDHPMVRVGLKSFLELSSEVTVVGEQDNGLDAVKMAANTDIDVLLMDLVMPGEMDGIAAIQAISEQNPTTRIIALTSFVEPDRILSAISAGAVGYLHKDVMPDALLGAIRQAAGGRIILEPQALEALRNHHASAGTAQLSTRNPSPSEAALNSSTHTSLQSPLTGREHEVLSALAQGLSNKEIAASLGITEKTVKVHISHILAKLDVYDRTQAVIAAARLGLIQI